MSCLSGLARSSLRAAALWAKWWAAGKWRHHLSAHGPALLRRLQRDAAGLVRQPRRCEQVGNLSRSERNINRWFDASGYTTPAPFTFGNSARNHLFGPGDIVFDVSVIKDTAITERGAQFRAEFFKISNHANFNNPGANISVAASLGRITSAGDPRQIQFGLKLLF